MTRKTAKRKKGASEAPSEVPRETTTSEPVQPEETQSIHSKSRVDSTNVGRGASPEVDEHDSTPTTPHTTPSSEPRRRQDDEESDPFGVDFDASPEPFAFRNDEPRRHESISEDEAEADVMYDVVYTQKQHGVMLLSSIYVC
jgi:hypothetical protein